MTIRPKRISKGYCHNVEGEREKKREERGKEICRQKKIGIRSLPEPLGIASLPGQRKEGSGVAGSRGVTVEGGGETRRKIDFIIDKGVTDRKSNIPTGRLLLFCCRREEGRRRYSEIGEKGKEKEEEEGTNGM